MNRLLADLGLTVPVIAAPMAGGPTTADLVVAAAGAGSIGFLGAGYKSPELLVEQIAAVRHVPFGVNLFAPNPVRVDAAEFRRYATAIRDEAARYGLDVDQVEPIEDDDHWHDKIDVLLADPVPLVSFTFGIPDGAVLAALRQAGTVVGQTVTSADEARQAVAAGVDLLVVQSAAGGGHSATLTPDRPPSLIPVDELVAEIAAVVDLPLLAAGGIASASAVTSALRAGADAVMVGTVLLRSDESGASATHRAALADPGRTRTVTTRAFTGRPARGLRNDFIARYEPIAPLGYPALHHLTSPMRKAAAAAGDPERVNLWAGTGFAAATDEPAATILARLAG